MPLTITPALMSDARLKDVLSLMTDDHEGSLYAELLAHILAVEAENRRQANATAPSVFLELAEAIVGGAQWAKTDTRTRAGIADEISAFFAAKNLNIVAGEIPAIALHAARIAYRNKESDADSIFPTEHPDEGGGPVGYAIRAALAVMTVA